MGILPEALFNYLLRLGWGHGDDEIISREQAIAWFDLDHVGKSPSRFDMKKLENLNGHYIREADDARLAELVAPRLGPDADLGAAGPRDARAQGPRAHLNQLADGAAVPVRQPAAGDGRGRRRAARPRSARRCCAPPISALSARRRLGP